MGKWGINYGGGAGVFFGGFWWGNAGNIRAYKRL